ncbi:NAD(P)H-dependent oxidoreductase [Amycolatopsis sp. H6(2020)]|nr:NAD(P)H-dependent oxidoreductase [Amycolatopsis sp. H6(2020)]
MPHLLHLDSSARRSSFSRELSARYAAGWTGTRTYRDLAADPVPVIGEGWTRICDALRPPRALPPGLHRRALRRRRRPVRARRADQRPGRPAPRRARRRADRSRDAALEAISWAG